MPVRTISRSLSWAAVIVLFGACASGGPRESPRARTVPDLPDIAAMDHYVERLRREHHVPGVALAIIDHGEVKTIRTYGHRSLDPPAPLDRDTVMYGASLTKFVFATYVMTLVDQGLLELDKPVADYFPRPLPEYEEWADLKDDPRWRQLTLRMLLDHTSGWANYRFFPYPLPPSGIDRHGRLKFYYHPGSRYGYSGEGYILAQRVIEQALQRDLAEDMQRQVFGPLGMTRTSMTWRDDFAPNYAVGYKVDGSKVGHNMQDNARAAGSMDTTIADYARFVAAYMRGDLLSAGSRAEMLRPQIAITSAHKFPPLDPATDAVRNREVGLAAGLGVVRWDSPWGTAFMKAGHNEITDNMMFCVEASRRCVVLLSNTAKGETIFPQILKYILGDTRFPWRWEYNTDA